MITQNQIRVNSVTDVSVLNNRYAVVRDVNGIYRVVSLLREPARELQPRTTSGGISYVFNRTGQGASWHKESFNQRQLANMVQRYGKAPTQSELLMLSHVVLGINNREVATGTAGDPWMQKPVTNTQLDPHKGGWVIATLTPQGLLFGSKPKVHTNERAADAELRRLAEVSPGTEFVLLKVTKTAIAKTVQTRCFM